MADSTLSLRTLAIARLLLGGLQGLALYLIYVAYDERSWPATNGFVFAPALLIALFVPLLVSQALGNLRLGTLARWAAVSTAVIGALALYDIWHSWPVDWESGDPPASRPHVVPSPELFVALVAGLFIAHSLITGGDVDRRFVANYTTHFDVAWKLAVQGVLSVAFVGTFWLVLWLGAALFDLINIDFFEELIRRRWFAIPATTLAFSAALHVTDVRAGLVRGIRTLGLALLSWLLPLMVLIAVGFLGTLLFTGVQPLWDTQFAATLLLIAFGALVVLLNAAYQDGHAARETPRVLRYPGSITAFALAPLAGLAGYAVLLRVGQYGWTAPRIYAFACALVAGFYAAGYVYAAVSRCPWLKRIERWNFFGSLLVLAVLLALFTPIADPYRISVASQVARLESGAITPQQFDFSYLRWSGGRYGQAALAQLAATTDGAQAQYIREAADRALVATNRYARPSNADVARMNVVVRPAGATLPPSFLAQDWNTFGNAYRYVAPVWCLRNVSGITCDAWVMDLDADGAQEILLVAGDTVHLFRLTAETSWTHAGSWSLPNNCPRITGEMAAGRFVPVQPDPRRWPDLEISGMRFQLLENDPIPACPN
jgi:hypothetical protein